MSNPNESSELAPFGPKGASSAESGKTAHRSPLAAILKSGMVVSLLATGFVAFSPDCAVMLLLAGAAASVILAVWPSYYQRFEAWMCLLVVLSCGSFGLVRFIADLAAIHPWDRDDLGRLYVGFGLIAGIVMVVPYILLRLAFVRERAGQPPTEGGST